MKRINPAQLGGRSDARERAVELAYEMDRRGLSLDELLATLTLDPEPFAVALLRAVEDNTERIDGFIVRRSSWKIERMAILDLIVIRLALAELIALDTPSGVILAEAVALASRYSTDESGRFVNGLTAAAVREFRDS